MNWQDLQQESLENLVEFLTLGGDTESEAWADAAFINITFRYRADLLEKCVIMCQKSNLTETDAEQVTNRAFDRVRRYPTFRFAKCKIKNIETCFRLYLYKIARRVLFDYNKPDEHIYNGQERVITSLINPEQEYKPETLHKLQETEALLDELFKKLSPKHKVIYFTYITHQRKGKYLPDHLCEELRNVLQLSQSTIRAYKKAAFDLVHTQLKLRKKHAY